MYMYVYLYMYNYVCIIEVSDTEEYVVLAVSSTKLGAEYYNNYNYVWGMVLWCLCVCVSCLLYSFSNSFLCGASDYSCTVVVFAVDVNVKFGPIYFILTKSWEKHAPFQLRMHI